MRTEPQVAIVMATFNGERFLAEQLQSLRDQSLTDWQLWVRDDESEDATRAMLRRAAEGDSRIHLVDDKLGRLGPARNFGELLRCVSEVRPDYVCLCDQDDVWLPHKLARQVAAIQAAETRAGRNRPLLVHSDLALVDADLRPLRPSLVKHLRLCPETAEPLRTLLVQNFVTGSTIVINRSLWELALPFSGAVVLHDWWLALLAAAAGELHFIPDPLVNYRQHPGNQVGAIGLGRRIGEVIGRGRRGFDDRQDRLQRSVAQAAALEERLRTRLVNLAASSSQTARSACQLIQRYLALFSPSRPAWQRPLGMLNLRVGRQMWLKQAAFLFQVAMLPPAGDEPTDRRAA
jgi:glycosyltransferase involved in cell wall biosynthesis